MRLTNDIRESYSALKKILIYFTNMNLYTVNKIIAICKKCKNENYQVTFLCTYVSTLPLYIIAIRIRFGIFKVIYLYY